MKQTLAKVLTLVACVAAGGPVHANGLFPLWQEVGDAGDLSSPQDVGYLAIGISGTIGGPNDQVDVFRFSWLETGDMEVALYGDSALGPLNLRLYAADRSPVTGWVVVSANTGNLDLGDISAGTYLLKLASSQNVDPPWSLNIYPIPAAGSNEPSIGPPLPEPATLALFGLGLAGLGAMRRKKLAA
jgi:hypothetical protein